MLNLILLSFDPTRITDLIVGLAFIASAMWLLSSDSKKLQLATNKKNFIKKVIEWGLTNINYPGLTSKNRSVFVEVQYYKHKRKLGEFVPSHNKIKVYVNSHADVKEMVNTAIHELIHHYQFSVDKKHFQTNYTKLLNQLSYKKHPMEIEAREMASQYTDSCIKALEKQGLIKS